MSYYAAFGPVPLDEALRGSLLNAEVAQLARDGYVVQSSANYEAVLSRVRRIGWLWNALLVILTGGLWLFYVIYRALNRKSEVVVLAVDQYGQISHT